MSPRPPRARRGPDAPRPRALRLPEAEARALRDAAASAGGWRPLARAWPPLTPSTLRRAGRGERVTPLVAFALRVLLLLAPDPQPQEARAA